MLKLIMLLSKACIRKNVKNSIDMEMTINVLEADWKIADRKVVQSLVAVQDQEGRWVQY